MSLNDIQLPPALLAELYGSTLIIEEITDETHIQTQPGSATEEKKPVVPGSLGLNKKKICIIVRYPDNPVIPDEDLKFLTGILTACRLSLDDVVITNLQNLVGGFKALHQEFNPVNILLFGVSPADIDLPMNFPEFQVQSYAGQTFLVSPPLPAIEKDKLLKSKLWVSLRRLFNI